MAIIYQFGLRRLDSTRRAFLKEVTLDELNQQLEESQDLSQKHQDGLADAIRWLTKRLPSAAAVTPLASKKPVETIEYTEVDGSSDDMAEEEPPKSKTKAKKSSAKPPPAQTKSLTSPSHKKSTSTSTDSTPPKKKSTSDTPSEKKQYKTPPSSKEERKQPSLSASSPADTPSSKKQLKTPPATKDKAEKPSTATTKAAKDTAAKEPQETFTPAKSTKAAEPVKTPPSKSPKEKEERKQAPKSSIAKKVKDEDEADEEKKAPKEVPKSKKRKADQLTPEPQEISDNDDDEVSELSLETASPPKRRRRLRSYGEMEKQTYSAIARLLESGDVSDNDNGDDDSDDEDFGVKKSNRDADPASDPLDEEDSEDEYTEGKAVKDWSARHENPERKSTRTKGQANYNVDEEADDLIEEIEETERMRRDSEVMDVDEEEKPKVPCFDCKRLATNYATCSVCNHDFHWTCQRLKAAPADPPTWKCLNCRNFVCDICNVMEKTAEGRESLCRCSKCYAYYHYDCIAVKPESIDDPANWICSDCVSEGGKKIDQILRKRDGEDPDAFEYLVKWVGLSHIHNSWLPERRVKRLEKPKYAGFLKREESGNLEDTEMFATWEQLERIVGERHVFIATARRDAKLTELRRGEGDEKEFYSKWAGLEYDSCEWESAEVVQEGFAHKVKAYEARLARASRLRAMKQKKIDPDEFENYPIQPAFLPLKLHKYQLVGLNWLRECYYKGQNCMLADEMGLGKTIQAISFMLSLQEEKEMVKNPFLVMGPKSTLLNWLREFDTWAPSMNVIIYSGNQAARDIIKTWEFYDSKGRVKFDVMLVSYEMALRDAAVLKKFNWAMLMVDEGHRLKNADSQLHEQLVEWNVERKVLLTGTPLQNNMKELFSLLQFLDPTNDASALEEEFQTLQSQDQVKRLHELLKPYILRRLKKDVLKDLIPPKESILVPVSLTKVQKEQYRALVTKNYAMLTNNSKHRKRPLMNLCMQLQKVCNHPYLFDENEPKFPDPDLTFKFLVEASGKLVLLDKLLPKLKQRGHRVLIFSHMTHMLDILEDYVIYKGYGFLRLDGSTSAADRQAGIDKYNTQRDKYFLYLISTRAGGLGVNLASADTVILYDSDFNPHADLQALSRAHRLGQKNKVMVYQLVTPNSIEGAIVARAHKKLALENVVIRKMGQDVNDGELSKMLQHGMTHVLDDEEAQQLYDDEAIVKLLDRDRSAREEEKKKGEEDDHLVEYLGEFSVAKGNSDMPYENDAYWEQLLKARHDQWQLDQEQALGRGKRHRKKVNYKDNLGSQELVRGDDEFQNAPGESGDDSFDDSEMTLLPEEIKNGIPSASASTLGAAPKPKARRGRPRKMPAGPMATPIMYTTTTTTTHYTLPTTPPVANSPPGHFPRPLWKLPPSAQTYPPPVLQQAPVFYMPPYQASNPFLAPILAHHPSTLPSTPPAPLLARTAAPQPLATTQSGPTWPAGSPVTNVRTIWHATTLSEKPPTLLGQEPSPSFKRKVLENDTVVTKYGNSKTYRPPSDQETRARNQSKLASTKTSPESRPLSILQTLALKTPNPSLAPSPRAQLSWSEVTRPRYANSGPPATPKGSAPRPPTPPSVGDPLGLRLTTHKPKEFYFASSRGSAATTASTASLPRPTSSSSQQPAEAPSPTRAQRDILALLRQQQAAKREQLDNHMLLYDQLGLDLKWAREELEKKRPGDPDEAELRAQERKLDQIRTDYFKTITQARQDLERLTQKIHALGL